MISRTANPPTCDRAARNLYVAALSGYMTGELDNLTLDDVFADISDTQDATLFEIAYQVWHTYDDLRSHPIDVDEETWDTLARVCVFLTTDMVHERAERKPRWGTARQKLAWVYLLLLVMTAAAGWVFGWQWLALGWAVLGMGWAVRTMLGKNREPDPTVENPSWPFADAEQWASYEPKLVDFDFPRWSAWMENVEIRSSLSEWLFKLQAGLLVVVMLPVVLLWTVRPQVPQKWRVVDLGVGGPGTTARA